MKHRLDQLLVHKGLAESRSKAESLIMSGAVFVDGVRRDKPGWYTKETVDIHVQSPPQYVSRAGEKLASANQKFNIDFSSMTVLDVGSSTGGFTDYALQHGAAKVYAVDVGTNQLHEKLRADPRIVIMEQTDIRDVVPVGRQHATRNHTSPRLRVAGTQHATDSKFQIPNSMSLPELTDIATIDVSFISLRAVLPYVAQCVKKDGVIIAMCKPQFEAGVKDATKHKGVIKNDRLRRDILKKFELWLKQNGFLVRDKADSEVAGAKGNKERFYLLTVAKDRN